MTTTIQMTEATNNFVMQTAPRRSCDRCHDQKLRCVRNESSKTCVRCQRAMTECISSRRQRSSRTSTTNTNSSTASKHPPNTQSVSPKSQSRPTTASSSAVSAGATPAATTAAPTINEQASSNFWSLPMDLALAGDSLPTPQDLDLPTSSIIIDQSVLANLPAISEYAANFSSSTGSAENPLSTADADGMDWSLMQETFNFDANSQRGSMDMFQFNGGSAGTDGYRQIVLESPPVESPREEGVQNTSHWVEKLSDINIKLFQHMSSIPPVETGSCGKAVVFPDKQFAIDKTFHLAQIFIEVLNHLYPRYRVHAQELTPARSPVSSIQSQSPGSNSTTSSSSQNPISLDQGSELLVLSSYCRLIEAFDKIFKHIQACISRTRVTSATDYFQIPQLNIGTFSLPSSSATQITLVIHLIESMMGRIRNLIGEMISARTNEEALASHQALLQGVTKATLEAMNVQEAATVKLINNVKRLVLQSSLL